MTRLLPLVFTCLVFVFCAMCKKDPSLPAYKTKHVVIIVVDGARYQETWGNGELTYIPRRAALSQEGCIFTNFYNSGLTYTNAGHTAMTTGIYETIANNGYQLPSNPSIFQYWRKATAKPADKAWVISTKDKLHILSNCTDTTWEPFRPMFDCGVNGPFTGYRDDSTTLSHAMNVFQTWHPDVVLINFKEPDASGHANDWPAYLNGVMKTDEYVGQIWDYLQSDPYYAGTTTLFVTNDHGRHDDGWLDGFVSHGDNCNGCRHIELLAVGPDFKQNYICSATYSLVDIPRTISQLMMFPMSTGNGQVMHQIFK
jgi:arylsulfatase A-like enzyme